MKIVDTDIAFAGNIVRDVTGPEERHSDGSTATTAPIATGSAAEARRGAFDAELVELRRGNPASYERLVREHGGRLLRLARRFVDEDEAHDVVQETFLRAFEAIGRFRGESCLSTWLHRIAVNFCLQRLRRAKGSREIAIETALPRFDEDGRYATPPTAWPDGVLERLERGQGLRRCLERLPLQYRIVIVLRDLEDLGGTEVAVILGISTNLVKVRLHRARRALRTLLEAAIESESARDGGRLRLS